MGELLQYSPFNSIIEPGFWFKLNGIKLDELKLSDAPIPIKGFYSNVNSPGIPTMANVDYTSFDKTKPVPSNCFPLSGILINTNTIEEYKQLDKNDILRVQGETLLESILNGEALQNPLLLNKMFILCHADLKKYNYFYWFCFPALSHNEIKMSKTPESISHFLPEPKIKELEQAYHGLKEDVSTKSFFLVHDPNTGPIEIVPISHYNKQFEGKLYVGFSDPSNSLDHPGWPLRNLLTLLNNYKFLEKLKSTQGECIVVALRRDPKGGPLQIGRSVVFFLDVKNETPFPSESVAYVGWEKNATKKLGPRLASLGKHMNPHQLAQSAVDLNLKLMRWRMAPDINLEKLFSTKCLLLGAGALGCNVARILLAWGVKNITLVDNKDVSDTAKQTLFNHEDHQKEDKNRAIMAKEALQKIYPIVNSVGINFTIPSPSGTSISLEEEGDLKKDVETLEELIKSHDTIFLLTNESSSLWLPTLLAAVHRKLAITVYSKGDSFTILRHGIKSESGLLLEEDWLNSNDLGCFLCQDPKEKLELVSSTNRPGLAMFASSLAVELMVSLLQHPEGGSAPAHTDPENLSHETESTLGVLPHLLRVNVSELSHQLSHKLADEHCAACSKTVIENYQKDGFKSILEKFNSLKIASPSLPHHNLGIAKEDYFSKTEGLKCLLLGAGTLGCNVARALLNWRIRHITFVDYGEVSYSNPVRQSLFTFKDCTAKEKSKSIIASQAVKSICPDVVSEGIKLSIPMPGHSVPQSMVEQVIQDIKTLEALIQAHDVIFLLMDTRESRWLPTLLGAFYEKVVINSALGFDSYLVQRHGQSNKEAVQDITNDVYGCYYCNDVVAPGDSTRDRTLDQQCTVTRPGVSWIAAMLAVDQLARLHHHPLRLQATAYTGEVPTNPYDTHLGSIPHQIRGYLSRFAQVLPYSISFDKCTACSKCVLDKYKEEGLDFLFKAFNEANYLEDVTGLTELHKEINMAEVWEMSDNESISSSFSEKS